MSIFKKPSISASDMQILETKHLVKQIFGVKVRGQITIIPHPEDQRVLLAKAGVKPPMSDKKEQNAFMLDLVINRKPGDKLDYDSLISTRDQWKKKSDLIPVNRRVTLNLEFDFRRKPVNPRMAKLLDGEHLAFDTQPWNTVEEGLVVRAHFDYWRKSHCLKTTEDFEDFQEYLLCKEIYANTQFKIKDFGLRGILLKKFIYAYAHELYGCSRTTTYIRMAAHLSDLNFPTKSHTFTYLKRKISSDLESLLLPTTPKLLDLWGALLLLQPNLNAADFFNAVDLGVVSNYVNSQEVLTNGE